MRLYFALVLLGSFLTLALKLPHCHELTTARSIAAGPQPYSEFLILCALMLVALGALAQVFGGRPLPPIYPRIILGLYCALASALAVLGLGNRPQHILEHGVDLTSAMFLSILAVGGLWGGSLIVVAMQGSQRASD